MKRLMLLILIFTGFSVGFVKSQVNVNININSQPDWGPRGYNYVESYYLPEYDIYYNVPNRRYYYYSGNRWLYSTVLPVGYRNINLYQTRKVVLVDRYPFKRHHIHYKQYAKYRGVHGNHLVVNKHNYKPRRAIVKVHHFDAKPRHVNRKVVSKEYHHSRHQKFGKIGHDKPHNMGHKGHR
ncbi:hypothetical protein [Epilithonimonas sp.]|uniref:hypothetical protein n=1 Tax=Epilithonimonas sp. TaxID=2894511 RepID=UPI0028992EF9|nr:hypothetical protein [Epilithonimonas sp.]